MSDTRPCGGDAYRGMPPGTPESYRCEWCQQAATRYIGDGKCLGSCGWRFFLLVALEVAAERKTGPSKTANSGA